MAAQGEGVLIGAADAVILSDVLARLRHAVDAVPTLHLRIDQPPADRRVLHRRRAAEGAFRLRDDEGRAAHALHPAGDQQVRFARLDRAGGRDHGVEAGAAEPVDRRARRRFRQAGEQRRHPRDVAVVLARLIGAAVNHVVQGGPVDGRMPLHQRSQRLGAEIVRPDARQRAAIFAEGRADIAADEGLSHRHGSLCDARRRSERADRAARAARRRSVAGFLRPRRPI